MADKNSARLPMGRPLPQTHITVMSAPLPAPEQTPPTARALPRAQLGAKINCFSGFQLAEVRLISSLRGGETPETLHTRSSTRFRALLAAGSFRITSVHTSTLCDSGQASHENPRVLSGNSSAVRRTVRNHSSGHCQPLRCSGFRAVESCVRPLHRFFLAHEMNAFPSGEGQGAA